MIAHETFKRFKIRDAVTLIVLLTIWTASSIPLNKFLNPQYSYIASLLAATALMTFAVHLINKAGTALVFYSLAALTTYNIDSIGATGVDKLIVLAISGIIFEIIFLILKLEFKNLQVDIIVGSAISSAAIPVTTGLLISLEVMQSMVLPLVNMVLLSFFIGIAGATLSFLFWYNLCTTIFALRFEY